MRESIRSMKFVLVEDENYGHNGWVYEHKPYFDPSTDAFTAHDILEEFPNGSDQPHDEFMALGASLYVRGQFRYANRSLEGLRDVQPHELTVNSLSGVLQHVWDDEETRPYRLEPCPKLNAKSRNEFLERTLANIKGRLELEITLWCQNKDEYYWAEGREDELRAYVPHIIGWLRMGWQKAAKRYRVCSDPYDVCCMFRELERDIKSVTDYAELGDVMTVNVYLRESRVNVEVSQDEHLADRVMCQRAAALRDHRSTAFMA